MTKRSNHVGRSHGERDSYSRYIRSRDYEPTVDETIALGCSDVGGEELREPTTKRKRQDNAGEHIKSHLKQHWLEWTICAAIAVFFFLMVDSKIFIARMDVRVESLNGSVIDLKGQVKDLNSKNNEQDLTLKEHSIHLSNIEEQITKEDKKPLLIRGR